MKDPIKTIGKILTGNEQRDAIHVAIVPVYASEDLRPGDTVALVYGTTDQVKRANAIYGLKPIGVIDPFIDMQKEGWRYVRAGQKCWLFIFPGTVTGMRHEWQHPAFDDQPVPATESERWLRTFADKWNFDYNQMISAATDQIRDKAKNSYEHYITARGIDLHSREELGQDEELFWYHVSQLTGLVPSPEDKESFGWSCTC